MYCEKKIQGTAVSVMITVLFNNCTIRKAGGQNTLESQLNLLPTEYLLATNYCHHVKKVC